MNSQRPQLALTVTLHDEEGLVAIVNHYLEDLAVLRAHQYVISTPAYAAHRQPYWKHRQHAEDQAKTTTNICCFLHHKMHNKDIKDMK